MNKLSKVLLLASSVLLVTGCGGDNKTPDKPAEPDTPTVPEKPTEPTSPEDKPGDTTDPNDNQETTKKDFEGITFADKTITYDASEHTITATNVPEGAIATYTNAGPHTNVGEYSISVKVTKDGYNDFTKTVKLIITKADFNPELYEYESVSVPFDNLDHIDDVKFVGTLPDTAKTSRKVTKDGQEVSEAINVGTYDYELTITDANYNEIKFTAKLDITTKEEQLGVTKIGTKIYFANQLDSKKLYSYDETNGIELVSNDVVEEYEEDFGGRKVFISKAGLLNTVKTIDDTGKIESLYSGVVNEVVQGETDGTYFLAINKLKAEDSGIFELSFNSEKAPILTSVYTGHKVSQLTRVDDGIYFISDKAVQYLDFTSNYVYTPLEEEKPYKATELADGGDKLVFNRNELLGDYIATLKFNNGENTFTYTKVTKDAGKYLNVIGNDVYYSNIDKLSTALNGQGVYKSSLTSTTFTGEKLVPAETKLSNLFIDGTDAYFYHVENKSLYVIDLSVENGQSVNLLEGFTTPEPITATTVCGNNVIYKGNVYYTNVYDNHSLYKYNPKNNQNQKITSNYIKDFAIYDDELFYNEVTFGVNNDTYRLKLTPNAIPERISTNDLVAFVKHGHYLYATENNALGAKTAFVRYDLNKDIETGYETINKTPASNYRFIGNKLYFIQNNIKGDDVRYIDVTNEDTLPDAAKLPSELNKIANYEIVGDTMYVLKSGKLHTYDLTNANAKLVEITAAKHGIEEFIIKGEDLYFVNNKAEIYTMKLEGSTVTLIYKAPLSGSLPIYLPRQLSVSENTLYFNSNAVNSYHFYSIDVTDTTGNQEAVQIDE